METNDLNAHDFILVGQHLTTIHNPHCWNIDDYKKSLSSLEELLGKCEFSESLTSIVADLAKREIPKTPQRLIRVVDTITETAASQLTLSADNISNALVTEASRKSVLVSDSQVPDSMTTFETRLGRPLQAHQKAILEDIIKCFTARLARPAIVNCWALGFDVVRTWIHTDDNRLQTFNSQLAAHPPRRGPNQVNGYTDFFRLGESWILQVCRDAQDALSSFTDRTQRDLQNLLDQRNDFAHANYHHATEIEAAAYADRMVRIVTNAPFA